MSVPQLTLPRACPVLAVSGNRMARIVISKEWHIQRYFCYGAVVKMALQHFRRYLRIEPAAYTNREGQSAAEPQA